MKRNWFSILLMLGVIFLIAGCTRKIDYSSDPKFSSIMHGSFKTKVDLIVFNMESESLPFIAEPGTTELPEASELNRKFPFDYFGRKILGILPTGAEFTVTKVVRSRSIDSDYFYYEGIIKSETAFNDLRFSTLLLNDSDTIPGFKSNLIEKTTY